MKKHISLEYKRVYFSFGWFSGQEFKLLGLNIFENICGDMISIIDFQVAKFVVSLGYYIK